MIVAVCVGRTYVAVHAYSMTGSARSGCDSLLHTITLILNNFFILFDINFSIFKKNIYRIWLFFIIFTIFSNTFRIFTFGTDGVVTMCSVFPIGNKLFVMNIICFIVKILTRSRNWDVLNIGKVFSKFFQFMMSQKTTLHSPHIFFHHLSIFTFPQDPNTSFKHIKLQHIY